MPGLTIDQLRVASASVLTASQVFSGHVATATDPSYVDTAIELESSGVASDDQAVAQALRAMLSAAARDESAATALNLQPRFVATRSVLSEYGGTLGSATPVTFSTTPSPPPPNPPTSVRPSPSPPPDVPSSPPTPSAPPRGPPTENRDWFYWQIAGLVCAGLLMCCLILLNLRWIYRLYFFDGSKVAPTSPMPQSPGGGGGVLRVGSRRGQAAAAKRRQDLEEEQDDDDETDDDDDEGEETATEEESAGPDARGEAPPSPSRGGAPGGMLSPSRGFRNACASGASSWTAVSYEPSRSAMLSTARYSLGPGGVPTFTLPAVSDAPRRARPLGGFTDAPPPERGASASAAGAAMLPAVGQAPWLTWEQSSSSRRSPLKGQPREAAALVEGSGAPPAPGGVVATPTVPARTRARGNVGASIAARRQAGVLPESAVALAAGGGGPSADCGEGQCAAPPDAERGAASAAACAAASASGKGVQWAPKPASAPVEPAPAATLSPSKKEKKEHRPPPELALAARVKDRVRERREQRAKSEAPP